MMRCRVLGAKLPDPILLQVVCNKDPGTPTRPYPIFVRMVHNPRGKRMRSTRHSVNHCVKKASKTDRSLSPSGSCQLDEVVAQVPALLRGTLAEALRVDLSPQPPRNNCGTKGETGEN